MSQPEILIPGLIISAANVYAAWYIAAFARKAIPLLYDMKRSLSVLRTDVLLRKRRAAQAIINEGAKKIEEKRLQTEIETLVR